MLLLCTLGVLALALVGLLRYGASIGRECAWCHAVACLPTRWWECDSAVAQGLPYQAAVPAAAPTSGAGMSSATAGLLMRR